ncbi:MAG TPA: flavin oxidoreductase [Oribacterium sp.]|nr:flavin oxidoreductase [Oribacterium sp.]
MRKNFGAKPYTYPQPVFIIATYGEDGESDAMNAASQGISAGNELSMCISTGHKTTKNILAKKAFTVSMADALHVAACDYVGLASGNTVKGKLKKAGFHVAPSEFVDAPVIEELAVCVECKLKSYDASTGTLVGEIVNVSVDESALDENGNVDVSKVRPIAFDPFNSTYVELSSVVGKAFSDGKKLG